MIIREGIKNALGRNQILLCKLSLAEERQYPDSPLNSSLILKMGNTKRKKCCWYDKENTNWCWNCERPHCYKHARAVLIPMGGSFMINTFCFDCARELEKLKVGEEDQLIVTFQRRINLLNKEGFLIDKDAMGEFKILLETDFKKIMNFMKKTKKRIITKKEISKALDSKKRLMEAIYDFKNKNPKTSWRKIANVFKISHKTAKKYYEQYKSEGKIK